MTDGQTIASGPLQPVVGQVIHLTDIGRYDLTGFRLSWRSDNTARVSAIEPPEIPGAMRCCHWATCRVAESCCAGKLHAPRRDLDDRSQCYDHKPYVDGGVTTWGVPANTGLCGPAPAGSAAAGC